MDNMQVEKSSLGNSNRDAFQKSFAVLAAMGLMTVIKLSSSRGLRCSQTTAFTEAKTANKTRTTSAGGGKGKTRIAIMSSFVPNKGDSVPPAHMEEKYLDYIINKACYSYIWDYDFIFNTTYGFDESYPKWHWLAYGHWSKVKHIRSRIEEYDYIFYSDTDFVIQDIMRPVESFLHEFELYGNTNVQLFLPQDDWRPDIFLFSNFAFLLKNSPFSLDLLKHWDDFARGVCPGGNLNVSEGPYEWFDSDQPGFYYAMIRAYVDHFPDRVPEDNYPQCNSNTGTLRSTFDPAIHPTGHWNYYFLNMANITKGSTGEGLKNVPGDQPFIFSDLEPDILRSGMALNMNWGDWPGKDKMVNHTYALHLKDKNRLPPLVNIELERCKTELGCYARYDKEDEIRIGCGDRVYA